MAISSGNIIQVEVHEDSSCLWPVQGMGLDEPPRHCMKPPSVLLLRQNIVQLSFQSTLSQECLTCTRPLDSGLLGAPDSPLDLRLSCCPTIPLPKSRICSCLCGRTVLCASLLKRAVWCDVRCQLNTDWTQVEVITLVNDGTGLGFGIIGGKSTGVVVKTILPGGVADRVIYCFCHRYWTALPLT